MKKSDLKKEIQRLKEEFELYKKDHVCIERKKIFNEHVTENNGNIVYFENYKYGTEEIIFKLVSYEYIGNKSLFPILPYI